MEQDVYLDKDGENIIMFYGILEIEIMNIIWALQAKDEDANISVADIVNELANNNIDRAYTTVKTVMDRLVGKEVLVRYKADKKFFYRTTIEKEEAAKNAIDTISEQFFNGSRTQMLRFIEKECEALLI